MIRSPLGFVVAVWLTAVPAAAELVVARVPVGSAGAISGLEEGDRVRAWRGRSATGERAEGRLDSVFDWAEFELEVAPRGGAEVEIVRAPSDEGAWLEVRAGRTEVVCAPRGHGELVSAWRGAMDAIVSRRGEPEHVATAVRRLEASAVRTASARWWRDLEGGRIWSEIGEAERARRALTRAAEAAREAGEPAAEIAARLTLALVLRRERAFEEADGVLRSVAVTARSAWGDDALSVAEALDRRGECARRLGRVEQAEQLYRAGLEHRTRVAPGSLDEAMSLNSLGVLAYDRGEFEECVRLGRRALEIRQRVAPGGLDVGKSHNNLGLVSYEQGDYEAAERHLRLALEIKQSTTTSSRTVANTLNNLALVAGGRGHLDSAHAFLEQALEIEQAAGDDGEIARTLNNIGDLALQRGRWGVARRVLERALELHDAAGPPTIHTAYVLANLGFALSEIGDLDRAESRFRAAGEVIAKVAPGSLDEARITTNIAALAWERGDTQAAEKGYRRAVETKSRLAPGSVLEASGRSTLGSLLRGEGRFEEARVELDRALEIVKRRAPQTELHALVLFSIGHLDLAADDPQAAVVAWQAALAARDDQVGRAGAGEALRAGLRARTAGIHRDLIRLLVDLGREAEAFAVLERSRAQELAAMLTQREVALRDLPPELERDRRTADVEYERALEALADPDVTGPGAVEASLGRLADARRRREEVAERVRAVAPRAASLLSPEPIDLDGARRCIGDRTAALAYVLDDDGGLVFSVGPGRRFRVHRIRPSRSELARRVAVFRGLVAGEGDVRAIRSAGASLYRDLVEPAAEAAAGANRIVVVPDGPLTLLPWAALARGQGASDEWLGEWRPLVVVPSLTVLDALREGGVPGSVAKVAAVADPDPIAEGVRDAGSGRSGDLARLPAARTEVAVIRAVFGRAVRTATGSAATEELVKEAADGASLVHLAAHVELDDHRPLESAVVLAGPGTGDDDGLLHAWEVMADLRLDRALVTLSGCDTGLGREIEGEGLIGLSRAFHQAGARSVMASLWRVEDRRAAELMRRFYRHLGRGLEAAEALRAAQREMIHDQPEETGLAGVLRSWWSRLVEDTAGGPPRTHPAAWAAFRIEGDWR